MQVALRVLPPVMKYGWSSTEVERGLAKDAYRAGKRCTQRGGAPCLPACRSRCGWSGMVARLQAGCREQQGQGSSRLDACLSSTKEKLRASTLYQKPIPASHAKQPESVSSKCSPLHHAVSYNLHSGSRRSRGAAGSCSFCLHLGQQRGWRGADAAAHHKARVAASVAAAECKGNRHRHGEARHLPATPLDTPSRS